MSFKLRSSIYRGQVAQEYSKSNAQAVTIFGGYSGVEDAGLGIMRPNVLPKNLCLGRLSLRLINVDIGLSVNRFSSARLGTGSRDRWERNTREAHRSKRPLSQLCDLLSFVGQGVREQETIYIVKSLGNEEQAVSNSQDELLIRSGAIKIGIISGVF